MSTIKATCEFDELRGSVQDDSPKRAMRPLNLGISFYGIAKNYRSEIEQHLSQPLSATRANSLSNYDVQMASAAPDSLLKFLEKSACHSTFPPKYIQPPTCRPPLYSVATRAKSQEHDTNVWPRSLSDEVEAQRSRRCFCTGQSRIASRGSRY